MYYSLRLTSDCVFERLSSIETGSWKMMMDYCLAPFIIIRPRSTINLRAMNWLNNT